MVSIWNNQDVVKNAYILYETQKEMIEMIILTFKEELVAIRKERNEERHQFMALIEKILLSK